jgi:magnesium-protoporphyrin O-methyltransferase
VVCCQCEGIEALFNEKEAAIKLRAYREDGPAETTRILIEALKNELATAGRRENPGEEGNVGAGIGGMTLLDIGGGVGAIQHELLRARVGVERAISVEASGAYIRADQEEAERQGHTDKVACYHADFVDIAPRIPRTDIVTLDRVICCYPDMRALVAQSAAKAGMLYGLVYPCDTWWRRVAISIENIHMRIVRNPFRAYVHRTQAVHQLVLKNGLRQVFYKRSGMWQVVIYAR